MRHLFVAALCAGLVYSGPVDAKDPPPFRKFSSKSVSVPKPGTRNLITIQIEPAAKPVPPAPNATGQAQPPAQTRYGWFWDDVSPALAAANPGRLDDALGSLTRATPKIPVPRLQTLHDVAKAQGVEILRATVGTRVSPALALAVIWAESAGKADATSRAGAQGLMQLMPATAARFGVVDSFQPAQNIAGGVKYLDWLMGEFDGDPMMVLAAYNAGEGAVRKHKGVPPYAETRDYVPKVLATFQIAKGLCLTPPELISDGCVFAGLN